MSCARAGHAHAFHLPNARVAASYKHDSQSLATYSTNHSSFPWTALLTPPLRLVLLHQRRRPPIMPSLRPSLPRRADVTRAIVRSQLTNPIPITQPIIRLQVPPCLAVQSARRCAHAHLDPAVSAAPALRGSCETGSTRAER